MSLRYSCAMIGRRANPFLIPAAQTSSLRSLALGTAHINNCYNPVQMRLYSSSNIVTLTPPWQFNDLTRPERKAFERWGPNFLEHVNAKEREFIQKMVNKRTRMAKDFEAKYGSNWYALLQEATAIKDQQEHDNERATLQDTNEYRGADKQTKRAMRAKYFDEQNATKAERLHKLMEELVAKRRSN